MFVVCMAAMIPYSARQALLSNSNRAEDWLPATFSESTDLAWFRGQFASGSVLVATWDGCTLGNDQQLRLLEQKLSARLAPSDSANHLPAERSAASAPTGLWFRRLVSGPGVIEELTGAPLNLPRHVAVERLEGSLVGPRETADDGTTLGDASRKTCLAIYLAPEGYETNTNMRLACEEIERVAVEECGVPRELFRLAGPPADNVAIDRTSRNSFRLVSALTGVIGMLLAYWCYRSFALTGVVVSAGWLCSGAAMTMVFYYGAAEVLIGGFAKPHYGTLDAVTMTMPAVIYVLGISAAVHIVNYYLEARQSMGTPGAAEEAVRVGWKPCTLAALTTAIGLGSLAASDIVPIKKFGAFSAAAVLMSVVILFAVLPVFLHRFPPRTRARRSEGPSGNRFFAASAAWLPSGAQWIARHNGWIAVGGVVVMLVVGAGMSRLESSVQVLKLLSPRSELIADYAWIENNLANVVPMEVVITVPREMCRGGDEHAESTGKHYRMTMLQRLEMIRRLAARIEQLPAVSRTMSVATLGPEPEQWRASYTINESLEENRDRLSEYLKVEELPDAVDGSARQRELWRITSRVSALDDLDYGQFVEDLQQQVEPLLVTYRNRDVVVRRLAEAGRQLDGAQLTVLFSGPPAAALPDQDGPAGLLARLLWESGVRNRINGRRGGIEFRNLTTLASSADRAEIIAELQQKDAVLVMATQDEAAVRQLQQDDLPIINLAALQPLAGEPAVASSVDTGPRSVRAVYTGVVPLVFKTQRQLLISLRESMILAALTIGVVMAIVLRNPVAGLISMIPNAFPLVVVFGLLGWLGVKIDIGIMMSASVALGVAVDDTIHFLTWFRRGTAEGLDRRSATLLAYQRCGAAMAQTTLIAGLGMAMFFVSRFMPTQRFGLMMVATLGAALVGDLVLLPALLCGPLGRFMAAPGLLTPENEDESPIEAVDIPQRATCDEPAPPGVPVDSPVIDEIEPPEPAIPHTVGVRNRPTPTATSHLELRERLRGFRRPSSRDE
jgi:predicted RND superfamily exporter protein